MVQRMIGPGPDIDQLGHPGADQLVEPFGHVAQGLGLVGQTLRDGVTRGGVIGWVLGCRPPMRAQHVESGFPTGGVGTGEQLMDSGGAETRAYYRLVRVRPVWAGRVTVSVTRVPSSAL